MEIGNSDDLEDVNLAFKKIHKNTIDPFPSAFDGFSSPLDAIQLILDHFENDADVLESNEKNDLLYQVKVAKEALENQDNGLTALVCYLLGMTAQKLSNPLRDMVSVHGFIANSLEAVISNEKKFAPIALRNSRKAEAKKCVQEIAMKFWSSSGFFDLRVSDMAEKVWSYSCSLDERAAWLQKELPNKASGLVPWLREVAPESARKPGRPPAPKEK